MPKVELSQFECHKAVGIGAKELEKRRKLALQSALPPEVKAEILEAGGRIRNRATQGLRA